MKKLLSVLVKILKWGAAVVLWSSVVCIVALNLYSIISIEGLREELQQVNEGQAILGASSDQLSQQLTAIADDLVITKQTQQAAQKISTDYLKDVTVMLMNLSEGAQGSGVWIQYEGKFYILTAGHMMDSVTDLMFLYSKGEMGALLKIVNIDKLNDLLLLQPIRSDVVPQQFTTLALEEPKESTEVMLVGSPIGIEDLLSDGRVVHYTDRFMYFFDHVYFGSSGGGVYHPQTGELEGIISHMSPVHYQQIQFVLHGAVRLDRIKEFMIQSTTETITKDDLIQKMKEDLDL